MWGTARRYSLPQESAFVSGSAFLSTGIWSLIQDQQHKHCLCIWRNYDVSHLLNCISLGIRPVIPSRSYVPLPLASLTPMSIACIFPSVELFLSYDLKLTIYTLFLPCLEFLFQNLITSCDYIGGIYKCVCTRLPTVLLCKLKGLERCVTNPKWCSAVMHQ